MDMCDVGFGVGYLGPFGKSLCIYKKRDGMWGKRRALSAAIWLPSVQFLAARPTPMAMTTTEALRKRATASELFPLHRCRSVDLRVAAPLRGRVCRRGGRRRRLRRGRGQDVEQHGRVVLRARSRHCRRLKESNFPLSWTFFFKFSTLGEVMIRVRAVGLQNCYV